MDRHQFSTLLLDIPRKGLNTKHALLITTRKGASWYQSNEVKKMCKQCPRFAGVKRYWGLPHWMTESQARNYTHMLSLAEDRPTIYIEYTCSECPQKHAGHEMHKIEYGPLTLENGEKVTHIGICPTTRHICYVYASTTPTHGDTELDNQDL